jgi:RNA polymerase sigma-70 factor (ECF subfamily)
MKQRLGAQADRLADRPDEEIVARILHGEEDLFGELLARYQGRVVAHLARLVGSREEGLDISQEVFLKVFQALTRYNAEYKFSTWIFRIASNAGIDFLRKRRLRTVSLDAPPPGADPDEPPREIASHEPDPQAVLRNAERRRKIDEEIAALPADFRELISLRHFAGLSYEEIAAAKRMPLGTVKNKLFRARAVLKDRLAGELS